LLWEWAKIVNAVFNRLGDGAQFSELAKREKPWEAVIAEPFPKPQELIPEISEK
jgi:hypothetical protein